MINDWTITEAAVVFTLFCLLVIIGFAIYGIMTVFRKIWARLRKELEFRYISRELRNPRRYARRRRDAREPIWDIPVYIFKLEGTSKW